MTTPTRATGRISLAEIDALAGQWDRFDRIKVRLSEAGIRDQHEVYLRTAGKWDTRATWTSDVVAVLLAAAAVQRMPEAVLTSLPYRTAPFDKRGVEGEAGVIAMLANRSYNVTCDALVALVQAGLVDGRIARHSGDDVAWDVRIPERTPEPECRCVFSCADDPATACSLSGEFHTHPDDGSDIFGACPAHPDAPGDV